MIIKKVLRLSKLAITRIRRHVKKDIVKFTNEDWEYREHDIGDYTYGYPKVFAFGEMAKLKIGKFCSIAQNVNILLGGEHYYDRISCYPLNDIINKESKDAFSKGDVTIGNDVWIGYGAIILSGVTIGNGAVIGAGAIVTKSVEPYSIVAGNPAKEIKKRFTDEKIKELQELEWWNWDIQTIKNKIHFLTI